jgi:phenylalanyl-tRNA synthetase beta chain
VGENAEKFITLDGVERTLNQRELLVCDSARPVCLAGVMGGQNTEVTEKTTRILLECAYFDPGVVRRQSRRLGLMSDSSYRFERGIDPLNQATVSDYAAALIAQVCGGEVLSGRVEAQTSNHAVAQVSVDLRFARVQSLLGITIEPAQIAKHLKSIGLDVIASDDLKLTLSVPGWRPDLTREVDLIEEVARLVGYDAIPVQYPAFTMRPTPLSRVEEVSRKVRHFLSARGLHEAMSLRFQSLKEVQTLFAESDVRHNPVKLLNPLSEALAVMPTSQIPSLLRSADANFRNQAGTFVRLFEIGKAFFPAPEKLSKTHPGVNEKMILSGVFAGDFDFAQGQTKAHTVEFLDVKLILSDLFTLLNMNIQMNRPENGQSFLHPSRQVELVWNKNVIGFFGELHPQSQKALDLQKSALVFEVDFDVIIKNALNKKEFVMFSRFGEMTRDISLLASAQADHAQVSALIQNIGTKNKTEVRFVSSYIGQGVPEGQKNLVYQVAYQSMTETLTDEVVQKAHDKLLSKLAEENSITIR